MLQREADIVLLLPDTGTKTDGVEEERLSVDPEVDRVVLVEAELLTREADVGGGEEDEVIEEEAEQLLLRFGLLQDSTVKEPPGTNRVSQGVEGDLLLE